MQGDPAVIDALLASPDAYPLELAGERLHFVPMTRQCYGRSLFLDPHRIVTAAPRTAAIELHALLDRPAAAVQPVAFIFHVAHCGSTLLARAVDDPSRNLVLREPYTLRQLGLAAAAAPVAETRSERWRQCLLSVAGLLSRRYSTDAPVIAKANVPVNFMLPELLSALPGSTGLLLYAGLEDYLPAMLKSPDHQRWARELVRQLSSATAGGGLASIDPAGLDAARTIAYLWLAQMERFAALCAGGYDVASLDCERLFESPRETLAACFAFWRQRVTREQIEAIVAGELFAHHAKAPQFRYDNDARQAERDAVRSRCRDDIAAALAWAEPLRSAIGVDAVCGQALTAAA